MAPFTGNDVADVIVAAHWTDLLGAPPADFETDLLSVGGTRRIAAELAERLQESSGTPFSAELVIDARTVRGISALVRKTGLHLRRIVPLSTEKTGVPFVMMPSGSGTVLAYHHFGGGTLGRPVHGVQSYGLNPADGPPLDKFDALMDDFASVLSENLDTRRVHLGGYCWGGIYAYELARRLTGAGWDVVSVTMINPTLEFRPPSAEEIVRNRLSALAKTVASGQHLGSITDPESKAFIDRAAATDEEKEVFGPRFHVFAMLWRAMIGYRPTSLDLPIRMHNTSDLKLVEHWSTLGLRDFQRDEAPGTFSEINFHAPVVARIRSQLFEVEKAPDR